MPSNSRCRFLPEDGIGTCWRHPGQGLQQATPSARARTSPQPPGPAPEYALPHPSPADAVEQAVTAYGRLDTRADDAGVVLLGPVEDAPIEEWDRIISIDLQGLLCTTRAALPHLLAAVGGDVSLMEPGPVGSELFTRMRPEVFTASAGAFVSTPLLHAEDIADSIAFVVTRPRHVAVDEVLIRLSTSG